MITRESTPLGGAAAFLAAHTPEQPILPLRNLQTGARFDSSTGEGVTNAYDGGTMIAEYNNSKVLQRRYVYGPGTDEPLVWYEGAGTSTRRYFHADERGSVVATSDGSGAMQSIDTYDEYGIPGASNTGRFQYTGQAWLSELGMYHYRARVYSPTLGRFLQSDPVGYDDQLNLYAYVGNDPVNALDPDGKAICFGTPEQCGAYRAALALARAAADNPALTASERSDLRNLIDNIRSDRAYFILFAPK